MKKKIEYDDFDIKFIDRRRNPIMFIIYINKKKYRIAYSEENYNNIKLLLIKTNSKFTNDMFLKLMDQYKIKPGFFDI